VLPNLLVDGVRQALQASPALKVYVCNVATQRGETDAFAVSDHFGALEQHIGNGLFHYVLANNNLKGKLPENAHAEPVVVDKPSLGRARVVSADVVSNDNRYHHDPKKLADALIHLYYERDQLEHVIAETSIESVTA
jgi:uncharacterized cofD-like protein